MRKIFFLLILPISLLKGQIQDIDRLIKINVLIRSTKVTNLFPFSPKSFSEKSSIVVYNLTLQLCIKDRSDMMNAMYDSLLFYPNHIKTGRCIPDQSSNGLILVEFYFSKDKINKYEIQSLFINSSGNYLMNNEEDEYIANLMMITYIRNNFTIVSDVFN